MGGKGNRNKQEMGSHPRGAHVGKGRPSTTCRTHSGDSRRFDPAVGLSPSVPLGDCSGQGTELRQAWPCSRRASLRVPGPEGARVLGGNPGGLPGGGLAGSVFSGSHQLLWQDSCRKERPIPHRWPSSERGSVQAADSSASHAPPGCAQTGPASVFSLPLPCCGPALEDRCQGGLVSADAGQARCF